jgi:DNA-binding response OmpR family regulator
MRVLLVEGAILSRVQLEERLCGWDVEGASNAVAGHLHHRRKTLDPDLIRNVRGVGHMIPKTP